MGIYDDLWWCKWGFMMMFVGRWWFLLYEHIDVHDIPIMISLLYRVSWNRDTHFTSKSWMTILVLTPVTRRYPSRNLQLGIWNLNWQTIMIYPLVMSKSLLKVAMEIVYLLINSMVDFSIFFVNVYQRLYPINIPLNHYKVPLIHHNPHDFPLFPTSLCGVLVFGSVSRRLRRLLLLLLPPAAASTHNLSTHNLLTHNLSSHNFSTHNLLTTTCHHTTCPHTTCHHTTCPHTTSTHTTCPHTTCPHTTCPHTTCSHTTCPHTTFNIWKTSLVITQKTPLVITQLVLTQLLLTQLLLTQLVHTQLLTSTHTTCPHTTFNIWKTSLVITQKTSLVITQLVHTQLVDTPLVITQLVHTQLVLTQLLLTQLVHTPLVITQRAHTRVAGVALGDIYRHFAWQAWHLATSIVTLRGRWRHPPSLCVAGVAFGDIDCHLAWQAWHLWHWAGFGGALGSRCAARRRGSLAWQACHLVTSTVTLRGRRGIWRHRSSFSVAGVALVALGRLWWRAWF